MKKSILLFTVALGVLTACNPIKEEKDMAMKHGKAILGAFDRMLDPLRILFERLVSVKTKEESDEVVSEINEMIERLENNDDKNLTQAVEDLLADNFNKEEKE